MTVAIRTTDFPEAVGTDIVASSRAPAITRSPNFRCPLPFNSGAPFGLDSLEDGSPPFTDAPDRPRIDHHPGVGGIPWQIETRTMRPESRRCARRIR